jgi:hypothetical protein
MTVLVTQVDALSHRPLVPLFKLCMFGSVHDPAVTLVSWHRFSGAGGYSVVMQGFLLRVAPNAIQLGGGREQEDRGSRAVACGHVGVTFDAAIVDPVIESERERRAGDGHNLPAADCLSPAELVPIIGVKMPPIANPKATSRVLFVATTTTAATARTAAVDIKKSRARSDSWLP